MKKMKYLIATISCFVLITSSLSAQSRRGNVEDTSKIKSALEVIGLDFTDQEISQMARGVAQSKSSYSAIREFAAENSVSPALVFNPLPQGFEVPPDNPVKSWALPANVKLPKSKADIAFLSIPELAYLIKNRKITSKIVT